MKTQEYIVKEPKELLVFLQEVMPETSRSKVKELLAHNVYVAGRRTSQFNFPLLKGMKVSIEKATGKSISGRDSEETIKEFGQALL